MAFRTRRRPPIVMRRQHHAAPLVDQDEAWSCAWSLVLGVGWALFAVRAADVLMAWYPMRTADPAWEFGAVEQSLSSLPVMAIGLAFVGAAAVLTERRRTTRAVATLGLLLGVATLAACVMYLAGVPSALHMATPHTRLEIRGAVVRVTLTSLAFSAMFLGTGISVVRHLYRNPV